MYIDLTNYDPLKDANVLPSGTANNLWSQIQQGTENKHHIRVDPFESKLVALEKKMQTYELQTTLLRLKVLGMEGKFTQEEVANIRKMIMSEDEASRTLANTIIENA